MRRLLTAEGEEVKVSERRPRHWRPFRSHALRHARATDLKKFYRFDDLEICQWTGWEVGGLSKTMARYTSLKWEDSFRKLLRPRDFQAIA